MNLKEFKTHMLLMEWTIEHMQKNGGIWRKGIDTIVWAKNLQNPDKHFIMHQTVGLHDGYQENRTRALKSFQACINFLDEEP